MDPRSVSLLSRPLPSRPVRSLRGRRRRVGVEAGAAPARSREPSGGEKQTHRRFPVGGMKMARHVGVRATAQAIGRVTWLGDEVALVSGDWSTADLQVSFYF
jgi:hypothetical protein